MRQIKRGLLALLAGFSFWGFQEAGDGITADAIRAHLSLLSSDRLEGRAPGTRGGDLAAEYIASQFAAFGLEPVGGTFFQDVPITGVTVDPTTRSLAFEADDRRLPARHPEDAVIWPGVPSPAIRVNGELVFVGYGIDAPEWDWDDFEGRDLLGKVLLFLVGEPPAPPEEPRLFDGRAMSYYGRWTYKLEEARRRGAAGALILHRPETAGYGWEVVTSSWTGEQLSLTEGEADRPLLIQGWLAGSFAAELLAAVELDLDELTVRAARRDFRPVATGLTVRARMNSHSRPIRTRNVLGYLPGLGDEVVVLTAHYDHLGIRAAIEGDSIYNGAYDNASGVSVLLSVAHALSLAETRDRSILFVATTAEEAGLLGAHHYVRHPAFPLERTAAAINIDGANLWGETDDVIAIGADRSTLGELLSHRAAEMRLQIRPDPVPEKGAFFRSDHFPFALAGVPVLYLQHGLRYRDRPAGWGEAMMARWERENYHQPSDEVPADVDLAGAVQQARLILRVVQDIANAHTRPRWLGPRPLGAPPHR